MSAGDWLAPAPGQVGDPPDHPTDLTYLTDLTYGNANATTESVAMTATYCFPLFPW
jgi:hypothetical protein